MRQPDLRDNSISTRFPSFSAVLTSLLILSSQREGSSEGARRCRIHVRSHAFSLSIVKSSYVALWNLCRSAKLWIPSETTLHCDPGEVWWLIRRSIHQEALE